MAEYSSIEWTDATWNPVTGCTKVSPGCKHCYAEAFAERWRGIKGHPYEQGFDLRLWPERLELPLRWKERRKIFVNSMSDLFHKDVPDEFIGKVFDVMRQANWHIFQLLTKRPERMRAWANKHFCSSGHSPNGKQVWPEQVWAGVSVETQAYVSRIRDLQQVPAKIRFLSIEPLLGPVDLAGTGGTGLDWVICGGESGRGARPMNEEWARDLRNQCAAARVPFFLKQLGGERNKRGGALALLDGAEHKEYPAPPLSR